MPVVRWGRVCLLLMVAACTTGADHITPTQRFVAIPFAQADGTILHLAALEITPSPGGRFPLVVISHGSPRRDSDRPGMSPGQYEAVGQWFAERGYAVVIPMRRGYGKSEGPWSESFGSCQTPDYVRGGLGSAQDIEAVVAYMRDQSFIDPDRIVLVGHSAGAWGSIAAASANPPGVVAAIAFAPGRGSLAPDEVCGGDALVRAARSFGATTRIPTLWIYSENDHFFAPKLARDIFDAFHAGTQAKAEFIAAPSCGRDGHMLVLRCSSDWQSAVAAFLQELP
jgi:dienelactone hydrolase